MTRNASSLQVPAGRSQIFRLLCCVWGRGGLLPGLCSHITELHKIIVCKLICALLVQLHVIDIIYQMSTSNSDVTAAKTQTLNSVYKYANPRPILGSYAAPKAWKLNLSELYFLFPLRILQLWLELLWPWYNTARLM